MQIGLWAAPLLFLAAPSGAPATGLATERLQELEQRFAGAYDERGAGWAQGEKRLDADGGFCSGGGPGPSALADTLAMGQAFLALFGATAEPEWLDRATDAARALDSLQAGGRTAFAGAAEQPALARFANLLFRWTGDERHRALAARALAEAASAPPDPAARALYAAARRTPGRSKRTDLWDRAAGPLRNTAVQFPDVRAAAAFVCSQTSCSLPITKPDQVAPAADRLARATSAQAH